MDSAEQFAEHNPHAAAQAFTAIACDQGVDDDTRLSAAEQVAELDPHAAALACVAIARDGSVGDEVRLSAAIHLAAAAPGAAVGAYLAIACDDAVGDEVRLCAAEQLAAVDPGPPSRPAWPSPATGRSVTRSATPPPSSSRLSAPAPEAARPEVDKRPLHADGSTRAPELQVIGGFQARRPLPGRGRGPVAHGSRSAYFQFSSRYASDPGADRTIGDSAITTARGKSSREAPRKQINENRSHGRGRLSAGPAAGYPVTIALLGPRRPSPGPRGSARPPGEYANA